jgi:hypothetical protein
MIAGYKKLKFGICNQEKEACDARQMDNLSTGKDLYEFTKIR